MSNSTFNIRLILLFLLGGITACSTNSSKPEVNEKGEAKELLAFVDSVSNLDFESINKPLITEKKFEVTKLNTEILDSDFNNLVRNISNNKTSSDEFILDSSLAKTIFLKLYQSLSFSDHYVFPKYYNLKDTGEFELFAISIPKENLWRKDVFFFRKNKVIAHIEHNDKSDIGIDFFINKTNNRIVYLTESVISGTGIWQNNKVFFKFEADSLQPLLNLMVNSNLGLYGTNRSFNLRSSIKSCSPLELEYYLQTSILSNKTNSRDSLFMDTLKMKYVYNAQKSIYALEEGNLNKTYSYYPNHEMVELDLCFIYSYSEEIKCYLKGENSSEKIAIMDYLDSVKSKIYDQNKNNHS